MESILTTVKSHVGITEEYEQFDSEIIDHINTVFFDLHQMGVGPSKPFSIEDKTSEWSEFDPDGDMKALISYMKNRVRLLFDPPANSSQLSAIERQIDRFEWRLNWHAETNKSKSQEENQNG